MTAPCAYCGGTDFSQPRGFYRQPGYSYEGGTATQPAVGPLHFDCADLWAAEQANVKRRETMSRSKAVTSKPHRKNR